MIKNRVHISQPRMYPHLSYLQKIARVDTFVVSDDLVFKKDLFEIRNKYFCEQCKGPKYLTLEVEDKKQPFIKLQLKGREQFDKHLKTLHDNYKKYPFYDRSILETTIPYVNGAGAKIYFNETRFIDYWVRHMVRLFHLFDIQVSVRMASQVKTTKQKTDRLADILQYFDATEYLSGAAGRDYLELDKIGVPVEFDSSDFSQYTPDGNMYMIYDTIFRYGLEKTKELIHGTK